MVAACAGTDAASVTAATIGNVHLGIMRCSLLQAGGDMLGMLLVALKDLQAGLQQAFQFGVIRVRNKGGLERAVDRLVIGDLVVGIRLVEGGAVQLGQFGALVGGVL